MLVVPSRVKTVVVEFRIRKRRRGRHVIDGLTQQKRFDNDLCITNLSVLYLALLDFLEVIRLITVRKTRSFYIIKFQKICSYREIDFD